MWERKNLFHEETWGQNGILKNFRGTGKLKAEYLITLVNKSASCRLKPLLSLGVFVFQFYFLVYGQPTVMPVKEICCFACSVSWGSEERGLPPRTAKCFFWTGGQDWCSSSFSWIAGVDEGQLMAEGPMAHSAHKADIPLAVLLAMLEEPKRAAGPRGMVGADFTIFDFIFFSFCLTFSRWKLFSKLIAYGSMSWGNRTCLLCNHIFSTISG